MRHSTPKLQTSFRLSRLARALAAGSLLSVGLPAVQAAPPALPTGLSVAAGQAQVNVNGSHMTVTNSSQAILNWNSFSIGHGAAVYFQQPNASSQVLNRVTGSDPSAILGNLGSNGKVWLLNPNGVLFGATARVDVGGMVASTLRMSDLDWTGGRYRLAAGAQDLAASGVRNQGEIRTAQGGSLALIAGTVGNEGLMRAPGGQVVLAAGQTVELVDTGSANLSVRVTAPSGQARNLGMIEAAGGRIDITAAAVNQDGIVRADALRSDPGGEVWIRASESIDLAPSSQTTADGGRGGLVSLQAASGRTTVQGTLSARGTAGSGGQAVVLGPEIGLLDGSRIDVSGVSAGGLAVVGGGAAGKDPRFVNARALYVSQQASISADATGLGDGGQIFLWSDTATRAYGAFSARGGQSGGNGGFIETSGGWLDARPSAIDTMAPMGRSGQWLLDPYNILIGDRVQNTLGSGPVFTAGGLGSSINSLTITAALANGNNVIISTGGTGGGTEAGNISLVNANINVADFVSGRPGSLTLFADASISMLNSSIRSSIGAMPVTFLASQSAAGGISLTNSTIVTGFSDSSNISGGFGAIALTGGAAGVAPGGASFSGAGGAVAAGLSLVNSRLDAGSAPVTLRGVSTLAAGTGVQMDASSSVVSGMLAITGDGSAYRGMGISGSLFSSGALSLQGRGAEVGVLLSSASVAANGRINITAGSVNLAGSTRVSSTATGDAILIADAAGPLARFSNTVGSQALSVLAANGPASGGRWIVYATDIKDAANYAPGGLLPAFRRYGAHYGAWSADAGNGLVFSTNEFATVSGNVNPRVYNGTTNATLASASVSTSVQGDSASLVNGSASFATKNVGTGIAVTLNAAQPIDFQSADGAAVFGYTIISTLSGNITPATLSLSGLSAANKVYDATTLATLAGTATVTPLGNDVVSISGLATARFADKNVGTAKPVSVSGLTLTGADAGNYILAPLPSFSADITRATLSLAGLSAANKVYDTTTLATIFGAATIVPLGNDAVSISGLATARFADKNVGTDKPVSVSGLTLSGADAGNYLLAPLPSLSADITRATLSLAGLSAANKVYDATTLATLFGTATITALGNDVVSISGLAVGSFADQNVGTDKPVSVGGLTLTGADAGNYRLAPLPNLRADITRATLSLAGLSATNKVYDATTAATLTGTAAITPLGNDAVSISGLATASFVDKNVGTAKPVSVSGLTLSGADAGNYLLAPLPSLSADITRATLSLAGLSAANKVYDATNLATLFGTAAITALGNDLVSISGLAVGSFADKNVGTAKPVSVSGLSLSGADAGNYLLAPLLSLSADIMRATLSLAGLGAANKVYDATTLAALSGTATITALGNDLVSVSGLAVGSFADKNVGTAKPVSVSGLILSGADGDNYMLAPLASLSADITRATLTLVGLSAGSKIYDGSNTAPLSGIGSVSFIPGDAVTLVGTALANFANANVGLGKPVTVSGLTLAGTAALNYNLLLPTDLAGNIELAILTYIALATVRSAGAPLTGLQGTVTGFVANETLASATSGTAVFSAPAGVLNQPGSYAVFGSGLTAMNYSFVQAPGNAQALSIVGLGATVSGALGVNQNLRSIPLPQAPPTLDAGGLVNLLLGPVFNAASVPNGNFGPTLVTGLSPDGIMQLLSGRDRYKDQLLADARTRLELAPDLANLRQCPSLEEAQQGKCLVSETLKIRAEQQRTLLATARARELALIVNPTASLDNLPPTAAGPIESLPPSDPTRLAEQANRQASAANATADTAAASSEIAPELLALARPTLRRPPLPAIDPLQTQLDLLLTNYRIKTAVLPQIERKIAIVVGVDVYADSTIPSLGNAVRDARAVAKMFESRLGYETIVLENATRSSVVGALNRLALTMEPQDSVIVYYAGHGDVVEATGLGYWLLSDSKALDPTTWLSNSDINRLVGQISAHQVALISDSCYSGTLTTGDRIRAKALPPDPQDVLSRKTVVVMTSGGNEPVFDEGRDGHSLFAWNLLNVLGKVNQWQPGGNVFERIRFEVARALPQRPQYSDSRSGGSQPGGDFLYEYRQLEAPK